MTILITGSSGKTARRVANILRPSNDILIASRSGKDVDASPGVVFDWTNPSTFTPLFSHPQAQKSSITAVYLVTQPGNMNPIDIMKPFIEVAREHGVKRFVLLSAIREDETTPGTGQVHKYLNESGLEWAVLRPTWFMENFSEQQHFPTIKNKSSIISAAGDGKISFVSAEDIAGVAALALTSAKPPNRHYDILGPEILSHDDVAALFTEILGRPVRHVRITREEMVQNIVKFGYPELYASRLGDGEYRASLGEFAILNNDVNEATGKDPLTVREYIEKHKQVWQNS